MKKNQKPKFYTVDANVQAFLKTQNINMNIGDKIDAKEYSHAQKNALKPKPIKSLQAVKREEAKTKAAKQAIEEKNALANRKEYMTKIIKEGAVLDNNKMLSRTAPIFYLR